MGRDNAASEEDVHDDPHVAGARDDGEEDGGYVGRTADDDAIDAGETGAEARSQDG